MITRIRELLEARQLSPTQFADLIGVGRPVISHILSERNKPSLEVVQKIVGAFPELSLPWLLAGTGPMLAAAVAATPANAPAAAAETMQPPVSALPMAAATVLPPPPAASPILPAVPARSFAVSQPSSYPQPPRFRPGAATPATAEASPLPTAASTSTADTDTITAVSPLPSPTPFLAPAVTTSVAGSAVAAQAPLLPPPATNESLQATSSLATPTAEAPASPTGAETITSPPNPAAALAFLGEPGKAIRRIVIFYRDGSFSDYLPEDN